MKEKWRKLKKIIALKKKKKKLHINFFIAHTYIDKEMIIIQKLLYKIT